MAKLVGETRIVLRLLPQDPSNTPDPVEVKVRGPLLAGPLGDRIVVFDYNRDQDAVYPAARPRKNGSFPEYEVKDFRFHQLNAYAIAARAIELVELELGRPLRWGFEGSRLILLPHAGFLANAFYSEATHSLQLFSFARGRRARVFHTALAHDIVAHETGHALLDAVRPRFTEAAEPETAALHEAIADLAAVFAALTHSVIRKRVVGRLDRANLLSEIAEGFEDQGENGWTSLRSLVRAEEILSLGTIEPHDLSLKLSRAVYACLSALDRQARSVSKNRDKALQLARRVLQRMVVRALDYLPPADATFADFGRAMLAADRFRHPTDDIRFRHLASGILVDHGILSKEDARDPFAGKIAHWRAMPRSWPRLTAREAYLFLDANRDRLALAPHAAYRDFVLRDFQVTVSATDRRDAEQVVFVYDYPVDVELSGREYGPLEGRWLTVWGGGTLVFDANGELRHHAEKPVTRARVRATRGFLRSEEAAALLALVEPTADDEIRRDAARRPWFAELTPGRLTLRSNAAARCMRGGSSRA